MEQKNHILIVSTIFPPSTGIGGRRWAKFAKYLAKEGYNIHVITAPSPHQEVSLWAEDVRHPSIRTYIVPDHYPYIFPSRSILKKIQNRLTMWSLRRKTPGNPYDRALFWKKGLLEKAKELIGRHGIQTAITTGAPFHTMHHMLSLKQEFPDLQLIADFRDPWTNSKVYGMEELSEKRKSYEIQLEKEVLEQTDVVTTPYEPEIFFPDSLKRANPGGRILRLGHAFDPDDFSRVSFPENLPKRDKIVLTYGGAMYVGLDQTMDRLAKALADLKSTDPDFYRKLEFHIYTAHQNYHSVFQDRGIEALYFHKPVPKEELFTKIANANISLLFLAEHNRDFRTTKFFECLSMGRPFLLLGAEGKVASHIRGEKLGDYLTPEEIAGGNLKKMIRSIEDQYPEGVQVELSQYSYQQKVKELIRLMENR